ncbi:3-oxoacyl-acyl-carrier-protein synthase I, chloroplastic [Porphyridium purpureum]|uniref:3-oxoacyl-[acyl-carrier-protein] synthase I, chloroplastic n=1 Tax=Porphyridium purpureum TaxID=35688 RepID=A0A5J4YMT0_PORPP|nr:3-oxoacyl-acyl-carrier-protein synthase I, chloroplastic [Porphyridium purpureum]|eukprot:POR1265..scf295_9
MWRPVAAGWTAERPRAWAAMRAVASAPRRAVRFAAASICMESMTRKNGKGEDMKRIVVTGTGVVSCFGTDPDVFYQSLLDGKSGVREIQGFDCADWQTRIAAEIPQELIVTDGFVPAKLARRMDPFLTYAMLAGKKALAEAGLGSDTDAFKALDKTKCGVLIGSGMGGLNIYSEGVEKLLTKGVSRMSPFFIPYTITNMGSALLAIDVGFMGPNYSISTACATGNYAINNAAIHMRRGEAELMVVGGVEAAIVPVGLGGFIACRALSSRNDTPATASRPWDKTRDGFVMGEGAGVLVLETLEHARNRGATILAEYLGGASDCDAHHMTEPRQDGSGVRMCIENALLDAGVTKDRVNYINAHATSTPAGDMAEYRAVRSVFTGDVSHIRMNGTKSMIGHALGAAGGLEAVATVKAIQTGKVHPTINVHDLESEVEIDIVANKMQEHVVDVGISNSFGFGGHNSTVVFTKFE